MVTEIIDFYTCTPLYNRFILWDPHERGDTVTVCAIETEKFFREKHFHRCQSVPIERIHAKTDSVVIVNEKKNVPEQPRRSLGLDVYRFWIFFHVLRVPCER